MGFYPTLLADVHRFAAAAGHPVHVLCYPDPHALSGPIADLQRAWLTDAGIVADRLLVGSFLLIDPTRAREAGLVPLWTMCPVESAVRTTVAYLTRSLDRYRWSTSDFSGMVCGPEASPHPGYGRTS
jgi:hypothetical protein